MKQLIFLFLFLVTIVARGQNATQLNRAIKVDGNVPGRYIKLGNNNVSSRIGNIVVFDTSNHAKFESAVTIGKPATPTSYTGITNNATTPVPTAGAGTIVYTNGHFFGWISTAWKQLDN